MLDGAYICRRLVFNIAPTLFGKDMQVKIAALAQKLIDSYKSNIDIT